MLSPSGNKLYSGSILEAEMLFPNDFPYHPPKFKFITKMFHPNVFPDGTLCMSILHDPGEDLTHYESKSERWLPIQTVRSILISVISVLSEPNCNSPANIDASNLYKNDIITYNKKVRELMRQQMQDDE